MTSSTSPFSRGGRGGPGLAVIDTPAAPPGWEDARAQVVRLVDPLGRAVAWLAPGAGGGCIGFAVRPSGERGTEWVHIFEPAPPTARLGPAGEAGGIAGGGVHCTVAGAESGGVHRPLDAWQFVERDPTTVTLATALEVAGVPESGRDAGDPAAAGSVQVCFTATLDDGALAFDVCATNRTAVPFALQLGLRIAFASGALGDARGAARVDLPGRPLDRDTPDTRVDIPRGAVVGLGGAGTPLMLATTLDAGVSLLRYLAPDRRAGASLLAFAEVSPADLTTLDAGATFHLAVALRVGPDRGGAS